MNALEAVVEGLVIATVVAGAALFTAAVASRFGGRK